VQFWALQFLVGAQAQAIDGSVHQPALNTFWDQHIFYGSVSFNNNPSLLFNNNNQPIPPISACTIVCSQRYYCQGNQIGPQFTIILNFQLDTAAGVTDVTATKQ
jgi:hypothetical protein